MTFTFNVAWPPHGGDRRRSLPDGTVGVPYPGVTFSATGGDGGSYCWLRGRQGTISAGLSLSTERSAQAAPPRQPGTFYSWREPSLRHIRASRSTVSRTLVINPA